MSGPSRNFDSPLPVLAGPIRTRRDLSGKRFERLTAVRFVGYIQWPTQKVAAWECVCDCGNKRVVVGQNLCSGNSKSCGCLSLDLTIARSTKHGATIRGKKRRTYSIWQNMKRRCMDQKATKWADYGGRGIKVCDRWLLSYEAFAADMGEPPEKGEIERLNNDGDYEPENCVWATRKDQRRNTRLTKYIVFDGKMVKLIEACEAVNLTTAGVRQKARAESISHQLAFDLLASKPRRSDRGVARGTK